MSSPRCAVYARKSTESEERQIQSIDDQVRLATQLIDGAPAIIITEAMSAKEPDRRPEFQRLVSLVEHGKVDTIIAWHPDRLSRNEMDTARICYLVRTGKLDLRFVNYYFDNSPEGMMMLQLALSQSQYYSSKLSKDVLRGLDSRLAKGWWTGQAPEGYLNAREPCPIFPDPERLPLIRRAFRLLLTGAYTVTQVLNLMNDEWGYRTRRRANTGGGKLSRSTAFRMFSDPFYAGWMLRKGEMLKGAHEPAISLDEFNRVQEIIKVRQRYRPHEEFTYRGLVRCADCNRVAKAELQRGRHRRGEWIYYRCPNPACPSPAGCVRENQIDAEVERRLAQLRWPAEFAQLVMEEFDGFLERELGDFEALAQRRKGALEAAERKRAGLLEMRLNGEVEAEIYARKDLELREEINQLKVAAERAAALEAEARQTVERFLAFRAHSYDTFRGGTHEMRRQVAAALGSDYRLRGGELRIEFNPLFAPFFASGEPRKTGSQKQKGPTFSMSVPHGWEIGILCETFRAALDGSRLPDLQYLS